MKRFNFLAKILFLFFAVISLGLVTVSCNDDDEGEKTTLETLTSSAWHLQKFVEDDSAIYPEYENGYETNKLYTVIFYDNYSLTMRANPNWHDGTFTLNRTTSQSVLRYISLLSPIDSKHVSERFLRCLFCSEANTRLTSFYTH